MTAAIIITTLCLTSLGIMWWLAFKAPLGVEIEDEGFFYTDEDGNIL